MPSRDIDSTIKVYTRQHSSNDWEPNESLTCTNVTDAFGLLQPHTANLQLKTPDMLNYSADSEVQTKIDEAKKAMRYNADVELQITTPSVYYQGIKGLWCRVSTTRSGTEETIFIGQIVGSDLDFASLMCSGVVAYGIDWCLSMQSPVGSLCYDINGAYTHFDSVPPHFNPDNKPNYTAGEGQSDPVAFDYRVIDDPTVKDNYWHPLNIVEYLLYQLNNQKVEAFPTQKRYEWFSLVTNTQLSLDNASNVFINQQKSSDYYASDYDLWTTLVQTVEVNGLYTLSINYDNTDVNDPKARLTVLELI